MFLIRWLRRIASLPFEWLGYVAMVLRPSLAAPLFVIAWTVSRAGSVGQQALRAVREHSGAAAALAIGSLWMATHPRPQIGGLTGMLALECNDVAAARDLLERARQTGDDPGGTHEALELLIAARATDDEMSAASVARRLEVRRDLSQFLSGVVQGELMLHDLVAGRWEKAERRARHSLDVETKPAACYTLWAVALRRGDFPEAQRMLVRVRSAPVAEQRFFQAVACLALGDLATAQQALEFLRSAPGDHAALLERWIQHVRGKGT
jgi:hypothetical protein